MEAILAKNIKREKVIKNEGPKNKIKRFLAKLVKAEIVDVDALIKSEEWPCLWRK